MARTENTVFICYRRKDASLALAVQKDLTAHGFDVFFDYMSVPADDFEQFIISNIRARAHFIVILTSTALDGVNESGDSFRREIETAIDEKRNIIPLFFEDLNFASPSVAEKLTGKLGLLKRYNGLSVPTAFFDEAMERLRTRFLNIQLDTVLHPLPSDGWKMVRQEPAPSDKLATNARQSRRAQSKPKPEKAASRTLAAAQKIGRYEIRQEIGRGGLGTVYRAFDPSLELEVAIKVFPSELASSDPQFKVRFEREGKNVTQLQHPAIVPVYDFGEQEGQSYFVMGYMPGGNLRGRIQQKRFTLPEIISLLNVIASALDYISSKGIIHRDLKPGNILFDHNESPYITDILDSRIFQGTSTTGNAVYGTPVYMAPEEARGSEVDSRAHIYSLGVILFEMLAGRPPYEADTPMAVVVKHISEPIPDIRKINPDLPDRIQVAIEKALAKTPESRYQTAGEMIDALKALSPNSTASEDIFDNLTKDVTGPDNPAVYSLMTPRLEIVSLDINDALEKIRSTLAANTFWCFPVRQDSLDTILGIVTRDQLTQNLGRKEFNFRELLKPPHFVPETMSASRARKAFKENDAEVLLVVDEFGGIQGLLTLGDLSEVIASAPDETTETKDDVVISEETEEERAIRLQAAIEANRLTNNRSQPVFNDKAQGEDQLGIKEEVEALAETMLLRDVEPPVAVGVMGGWGSGKSFVMYLIHQYVQATRAQPVKKGWADGDEKDPKIPAFVGHVYQINFNAWTYAKSNLWASLMDTIFSCLNRQMQLERLLAHRDLSPEKGAPSKEQIKASMLAGGDVFKKMYSENPQFSQDKELEPWRENLDHWSHHLLKGTLLWNVMRDRQVDALEKLKDTEEQVNQLKARRKQFEKERVVDGITAQKFDATARAAYFQSLKSFMLAFLSDQLTTTAKNELKKRHTSQEDMQEFLRETEEKLERQGISAEERKKSLEKAEAEYKKEHVSEEDIQKFLMEAKGLWGGVKTLAAALRRSPLYIVWAIFFFALFFAVPYVWEKYTLEFVQDHVAQTISAIIALLPVLTAVLTWIKKSVTAGLEARKIFEGAYVAQQAKHADEIVSATDKPLPQKISELQADISNGSLSAYDALIGLLEAQAEEQRQKIGPSAKYSNLMEFVQSRLDAATYENQLGLMHQVRQDIDELTFSLIDNASQDVFPRGKPRILLYIDDLDRCPPSRVVEVLEAVQLLLNTKLFIVILGLDTRYVTRALEKEYKEILEHEGDPSGLDYIEKIIQIPYRVRSIEPVGLRNYIEKQMDIEKEPEPSKTEPTPTQPNVAQTPSKTTDQPASDRSVIAQPSVVESQTPASTSAPGEEIKSNELPPMAPPPVQSKSPEPAPAPKPEPKPLEIELSAAVIQFKKEDLDDLTACCQKITLTPRSIKRLVNVFKLMKIFWFRADKNAGLAERDRPRPVKQAAMCLLALSSAYPEVMREVFVHLETLYRQRQEKTELFTALNTIVLPPGSAHELSFQLKKYKGDLAALKTITGNGQDNFGQLTIENLKLSTFNIVRSFSFVGDPVYWTDGDNDTSSSNGRESQSAKIKGRKNGK